MKDSKTRLIVDVALVIMLVFEMFYMLTGNALHEIVGVLFFATVGWHLYNSRKMAKGLANLAKHHDGSAGKITFNHGLRMVLAILLAIDGVILLVSSPLISNLLFLTGLDLAGGAYEFWVAVHIVSAYTMCALIVLHAAAHWAGVFKSMRIPYNPERRQAIDTWVIGCASVGALALGLASTGSLRDSLEKAYAEDAVLDEGGTGNNGNGNNGNGQNPYAETPDNGNQGQRGYNSRDPYGYEDSEQPYGNNENQPYGNREPYGFDDSTSPYGYDDSQSPYGGPSNRGYGGSDGYGYGYGDSGNGSGSGNGNGYDYGYGYGGNSGSDNGSGSGSGSGNSGSTGICPLCRKRCSLSAPRCNKPYQQGLL